MVGKYRFTYIKKHGRKFVITDLLIGPYSNKEELKYLALWISTKLDIVNSEEWANLMPEDGMAIGGKGYKHTEAHLKFLSEKMKGNNFALGPHNISEQSRINMGIKPIDWVSPFKGKTHSIESNNKNRQSQLTKKHSPETIIKMSNKIPHNKGQKGQFTSPNKGKKRMFDYITGKFFYFILSKTVNLGAN